MQKNPSKSARATLNWENKETYTSDDTCFVKTRAQKLAAPKQLHLTTDIQQPHHLTDFNTRNDNYTLIQLFNKSAPQSGKTNTPESTK